MLPLSRIKGWAGLHGKDLLAAKRKLDLAE
jgi:hypothetical protein